MFSRKEILQAAAAACLSTASTNSRAVPNSPLPPGTVKTIRIASNSADQSRRASEIVANRILKRSNVTIVRTGSAALIIELGIDPTITAGGFQVAQKSASHIQILGSNPSGLTAGCGKFLRTSRFHSEGFAPSEWQGTSVPACQMRGIYLATHFANWYEAAPIAEVEEYLADLALWGVNTITVTFGRWHYPSFDNPAAAESIQRLNILLKAARAVGLKVMMITNPTEGFNTTPKELLAIPVPDALGRRGHFGVNLCASKPESRALIVANFRRLLREFSTSGLDYVDFWPYDEGGCGCPDCWPWGAKGYPNLCKELSQVARKQFPHIKVALSTWMFDTPDAGEWEGLTQLLARDKSWLNFIQADSHEDFPRYPLEHGVPGGLPLINFPEISMWGQNPWGGYGANPLPARFQRLWNQTERKLSGGFPYSEGIYEDINKAICTQLYWSPDKPASETVKEYVAYEYSPEVVDSVARAIEIMETNHQRKQIGPSAADALMLMEEADLKLTPQARTGWRWRILYLRAVIDAEMLRTGGNLTGPKLKSAFEELTKIYRAENSHSMPIHPPVVKDVV